MVSRSTYLFLHGVEDTFLFRTAAHPTRNPSCCWCDLESCWVDDTAPIVLEAAYQSTDPMITSSICGPPSIEALLMGRTGICFREACEIVQKAKLSLRGGDGRGPNELKTHCLCLAEKKAKHRDCLPVLSNHGEQRYQYQMERLLDEESTGSLSGLDEFAEEEYELDQDAVSSFDSDHDVAHEATDLLVELSPVENPSVRKEMSVSLQMDLVKNHTKTPTPSKLEDCARTVATDQSSNSGIPEFIFLRGPSPHQNKRCVSPRRHLMQRMKRNFRRPERFTADDLECYEQTLVAL